MGLRTFLAWTALFSLFALSGCSSSTPSSACTTPTTQYYVDPSGSDSNTGLSTTSAWQTLTKVNSATLAPCSKVSFKSGGTWRGQLLPQSGSATAGAITYSSYGTGAAPILLGSVSGTGASNWSNVATYNSTLWRSISPILNSSSAPMDIGNLIFSDVSGNHTAGFKKFFTGTLSPAALAAVLLNQGDFWCDPSTGYVWMYSSSNPGSYYYDIEAAQSRDIIYLNAIHDVVVEKLNLMYGGQNGINAINSSNLTFQDLQISWTGGAAWTGHSGQRLGNGIQLWLSASNVLVQRNLIWEVYDTALTNQADNSTQSIQSNITYVNNATYNTPYAAVEIWNRGTGSSSISNVKYIHNTSVNPGAGWSSTQRPDCRGDHVVLSTVTNSPSNVVIKNNLFYGGTTGAWISQTSTGNWNSSTLSMDYNDYFQSGTFTQNYGNWSQWTQASGNLWNVVMTANYTGMTINAGACSAKGSTGAMTTQGDCFWDSTTGNLYLYSASNPGLIYSSILATVTSDIAILVDVARLYTAAQIATYQSYFNMDLHSFSSDPLFVSAVAPYNFQLTSPSPARNVGTALGVALDINQNARPTSGNQDLGAYKF